MAVTLRCVTYRQFVLSNSIGELMELLDAIQQRGLRRVPSKVDANPKDIHNIPALYEFLETLASLVILADADVSSLEEKYEDVRKDLVKIVSRLAEIAASSSTSDPGSSSPPAFLF